MTTKIQDPNDYAANYVQCLLRHEELQPPAPSKSGIFEGVLNSIHNAYEIGGLDSALTAWNTIKRVQEGISFLETWQQRFINANDLGHLPAPQYLNSDYPIYARGFNLIFGASNSGKSFFALAIAGWVAQQFVVIYIAGEGLYGFDYRWICWTDYYGLETDKLIFYTRPLQIMDEAEVSEFIEILRQHRPALIVIDTLARSAIGIEENSAKEIGTFINRCDFIRAELDCAILLIHHTGKSGKLRGSSALYAAADSVLALKNEDNVITVRNDFDGDGKNKYNAPEPRKYFQIIPHKVNDIEGAVIVEQDQLQASPEPQKLLPNQVTILTALSELAELTPVQTIIDVSGVSQSSTYRNLSKLEADNFVKSENGLYSITLQGLSALEDA